MQFSDRIYLDKPRADFSVSKVIPQLLWFSFAVLYDWLTKISRHFIDQSEAKPKPISQVTRTRFPALGAGYMELLRVLIGSLDCLRLL